jgi:predicted small metal-binding protein
MYVHRVRKYALEQVTDRLKNHMSEIHALTKQRDSALDRINLLEEQIQQHKREREGEREIADKSAKDLRGRAKMLESEVS